MAEELHGIQFFLGANSAQGFASLYDQWVDQTQMQAFYAIKGGAGCGKSTLMHHIARQARQAGWTVEYIRCSGDPDSLDGIYLPQKRVALADGTAPHRMDPEYTGATGHYVDLGVGYDRQALFPLREEIIAATQAYRSCYPKATRCISQALMVRRRSWAPLHTDETLAKTEKRAESLLAAGTLRIKEVAEHSGFSNLSYFSRVIGKATGRTPQAYRTQSLLSRQQSR